jgi:hypothetical protein
MEILIDVLQYWNVFEPNVATSVPETERVERGQFLD